MFRIDDPSAAAALPTPAAAGTEGFFTEGNPGTGVPATRVRADWLNQIQEEIRAVVVAGGLTPSKTLNNQLLAAIKAVAAGQFTQSFASPGWAKLPNGLILQWGGAAGSTTGVAVTFPIAFTGQVFSIVGMTQAAGSSIPLAGYSTGGLTGFTMFSNTSTPQVSWLAVGI